MGTPAYMCPEQFWGQESDHRGDQFSYSVALFEALYGVRPFSGDNVAALSFSVCHGIMRENVNNPRVPDRVRRVIERGLSHNVTKRWPSMSDLLRALVPVRLLRSRFLAWRPSPR